jgi:hypothetical protein
VLLRKAAAEPAAVWDKGRRLRSVISTAAMAHTS